MPHKRKGRRNPQGQLLASIDFGEVWGTLVDNGTAIVLAFTDNADSRYLWGSSWKSEDFPFPLALHKESFMGSFLGRAKAAKQAKGKAASVTDKEFCSLYPALGEFLFAVVDDEGKPRQTATLMIFADGGLVKALLNDRSSQQTLWAQGATLEESLNDLDRRIQDDTSAWRDNTSGKRQR